MYRKMPGSVPTGTLALSTLLLQASAQVLSCGQVKCPQQSDYGLANCKLQDTSYSVLGVSNFTSSLSTDPLAWTVAYTPQSNPDSTEMAPEKSFFLSTPAGFYQNSLKDVTGCALLFNDVHELRFLGPNKTQPQDLGASTGTCTDAVGDTCVNDLTKQAHDLAANGNLDCSALASALQASIPQSCSNGKSWGNITVGVLTGDAAPQALKDEGCHPSGNNTYEDRFIHNGADPASSNTYASDVTPILTVFAANSQQKRALSEPEVHMSCLKPVVDLPPNAVETKKNSATVTGSAPSMLVASLALLVAGVFMA